jgi:hypothetical protein
MNEDWRGESQWREIAGEDGSEMKKKMIAKALMAGVLSGSAAALIRLCGTSSAQVLKGSATQRLAKKSALAQKSALKSNRIIHSALTHSVRVSATGIPGGMADGSMRTSHWSQP